MGLIQRELDVLTAIVEDYIAKAQPVGSRTISKLGRINLSPASIRNTMADLTEKGYLEQPHASAGRVPTAKAYRLYLDHLMRPTPLPSPVKRLLADSLGQAAPDVDALLGQAAKLLSAVSKQVSMVTAPRHALACWRQIDFVFLRSGLVMAILVLQGGLVQKRLVTVGTDITPDDLVRFGNYLNHHFQNLTVAEVRKRIVAELHRARRELSEVTLKALNMALAAFEAEGPPQVFMDGTLNMLSKPEFADMAVVRDLLQALEDRTRLLELLDKTMTEYRTLVTLGDEAPTQDLIGCGVICSPYGGPDAPLGAVSVIGPLRMDYAEVVPLVNYTARLITAMLDKHF